MNDKEIGVRRILYMLCFVVFVFVSICMTLIVYREGVRRVSQRAIDIQSYEAYATTVKERILNMFRYARLEYEEGDFIAEYEYTNVTDFYIPAYQVHIGFDSFDNLIYAILPEAIPPEIVTQSTDGRDRDALIAQGFKEVKYGGDIAYIKEGVEFYSVD